jgi:membrane associated rhomboid family serine protease
MTISNQKTKRPFLIPVYFAAILWIVEAVNYISGHKLSMLGIYPRTLKGLVGIPLSPFLHSGIIHLILNTVPLIILGCLVILHGRRIFLEITFFIIVAGGAAVWIIGRSSYHVGASGLIFGYFGYLVSRGIFNKKISSLVISFITVLIYGSLFWGLLPTLSRISWEGHLSGFAAGILAAWSEKGKSHN